MENQIKEIMGNVFGVDPQTINDDSSMDNIESWDSLNHTNLVMGLEQGFGIAFETEDIIEMMNFQLIKIILQEKLK